jgi:hypothetical protein
MRKIFNYVGSRRSIEAFKFVKSGTPLLLHPGYMVHLEGHFLPWLVERDLL